MKKNLLVNNNYNKIKTYQKKRWGLSNFMPPSHCATLLWHVFGLLRLQVVAMVAVAVALLL